MHSCQVSSRFPNMSGSSLPTDSINIIDLDPNAWILIWRSAVKCYIYSITFIEVPNKLQSTCNSCMSVREGASHLLLKYIFNGKSYFY